VQVWLVVATIINCLFMGFSSGEQNIAEHLFITFIFRKSQAAVPGGRNSNSTPAQSAMVGCNT